MAQWHNGELMRTLLGLTLGSTANIDFTGGKKERKSHQFAEKTIHGL